MHLTARKENALASVTQHSKLIPTRGIQPKIRKERSLENVTDVDLITRQKSAIANFHSRKITMKVQ